MSLTGKRSGKLVAVRPVGRADDGTVLWLCQCDCGKTKVIRGHNLATTRSCGCLHNLVGRQFGRLLVVELLQERRGHQRVWLCRCDCGTEVRAKTSDLTRSKTRSCGCLRKRPPKTDITGQRFGRLLAVRHIGIGPSGKHTWECRCDCGQVVVVDASTLLLRRKLSCGCIMAERMADTRGLSQTPEHKIWRAMIKRCHDPANPHYKQYGQRGITVCNEWRQSFAQFLADVGRRPHAKLTLERKDNSKGYGPQNCVWVSQSLNNRNKRSNRLVTFNGVTKPLIAWAEEIGINTSTLFSRLKKWTVERALTTPPKQWPTHRPPTPRGQSRRPARSSPSSKFGGPSGSATKDACPAVTSPHG